MFHGKRPGPKKVVTANVEPSVNITVKTELVECDEQNTCRVCLKAGSVPIYGCSSLDISDALNTFGGIVVSPDDIFPKYLCHSCNTFLQDAMKFRKTARVSEQVLRERYHVATISEDTLPEDSKDNIKCNYKPKPEDSEDDIPLNYEVKVYPEDSEDDIPLNYQVKVYDKKKKIYNCKKCDLKFPIWKEYLNHKSTEEHKNMKETCNICKKTYASRYIKKHVALHKPETNYVCDVCGKQFIIQPQLLRHRSRHFYHLPFKCSLCPYRARIGESLKLHMRSHTGDKPYECPQCPSLRFANKSNLNRHIQRRHKTDDNFKCNECPRVFNTRLQLDMHVKVCHEGIKDHICNVCGKAFGYRNQMMKHQLKVHKREKKKGGKIPLYLFADRKQGEQEN